MEDKIYLHESSSPPSRPAMSAVSSAPFHDVLASPDRQEIAANVSSSSSSSSSSSAASPLSAARATPYTRCQRVQKVLSRLLCVGVALAQGVAMDAFLAEAYGNDRFFYLFVVLDVFVAGVIAVTMVTNFKLIAAIKAGHVAGHKDESRKIKGK